MVGLLNLGIQALTSNQKALEVTGQNIANVNTPGYSRQLASFETRAAPELGVTVDSVLRATDLFASKQVWTDTAAFNSNEVFAFNAAQLDDLLANEESGLSSGFDTFFGALQSVVDDPISIPSRELFLGVTSGLERRFHTIDQKLEDQSVAVNTQMESLVLQVSEITGHLAELNRNITLEEARGLSSNALKDKRDESIRSLSEIIDISVQTRADGIGDVNVFLTSGQPLVVGSKASNMLVRAGSLDPVRSELGVEVAGKFIEVTDAVRGGQLGGLVDYRDEVLTPAWNELGRIAITFAQAMNEQHAKGIDLDGGYGQDFFNDLSRSGTVRGGVGNSNPLSSQATVRITDASLLKASDYELLFNAGSDFQIRRESDGKTYSLSDFSFDATDPSAQADMTYSGDLSTGLLQFNLDGITVRLEGKGAFLTGDAFFIQPVRNGAEELALALTAGDQLALASPIRVEASLDNSGKARISDVEVTDPGSATFTQKAGVLSPPVEIVFNSGEPTTFSVFDITDPTNPQPYTDEVTGAALPRQAYVAGEPIPLNGFAVTLINQPDPGDRYQFTFNKDGVSDNRNALALSNLQESQLVSRRLSAGEAVGGFTLQDIYARLVEKVGTETSVANLNLSASEAVLSSSTAVRESISGVNLDEEAANLVKYQQAYQAAAQVINTSRQLFDTLLNAAGG